MKTIKPLNQILALILTVSSVAPVMATEQGVLGRTFASHRAGVDTGIPEAYRRSFSTSRNEVVMVFQGTHWRSLTKKAARGSWDQQMEFCNRLTRSDLATGKIPYGFRYETNGDGRVYLLRNADYGMVPGRMVSMR